MIDPARADRNLTPTSTALASSDAGLVGTALSGQMLAPVMWLSVVNDHTTGVFITLPATSRAPAMVAVYVPPGARDTGWNRVAVLVASLYAMVVETNPPDASVRWNVRLLARIDSLNVT